MSFMLKYVFKKYCINGYAIDKCNLAFSDTVYLYINFEQVAHTPVLLLPGAIIYGTGQMAAMFCSLDDNRRSSKVATSHHPLYD